MIGADRVALVGWLWFGEDTRNPSEVCIVGGAWNAKPVPNASKETKDIIAASSVRYLNSIIGGDSPRLEVLLSKRRGRRS